MYDRPQKSRDKQDQRLCVPRIRFSFFSPHDDDYERLSYSPGYMTPFVVAAVVVLLLLLCCVAVVVVAVEKSDRRRRRCVVKTPLWNRKTPKMRLLLSAVCV